MINIQLIQQCLTIRIYTVCLCPEDTFFHGMAQAFTEECNHSSDPSQKINNPPSPPPPHTHTHTEKEHVVMLTKLQNLQEKIIHHILVVSTTSVWKIATRKQNNGIQTITIVTCKKVIYCLRGISTTFFSLFLHENIHCGYSIEAPVFMEKREKYQGPVVKN